MTKGRKILLLTVMIVISVALLGACLDYGYTFHYSVTGGNGTLAPTWGGDTSPVTLRGGRKGQQLEFVATPNEGYRGFHRAGKEPQTDERHGHGRIRAGQIGSGAVNF